MWVYVPESCQRKLRQLGIVRQVERLRARIEEEGSLRPFFEPFPPFWKARFGKMRVLAQPCTVDRDEVLCVLDVLHRNAPEYKRLTLPVPTERLREQYNAGKHMASVREYLQRRKTQDGAKPTPKQPLPAHLHDWLQPPGWTTDPNECVVYESPEWVSAFRLQSVRNYWQTYCELVVAACEEARNAGPPVQWRPDAADTVKQRTKDQRSVIYAVVPVSAQQGSGSHSVVYIFQALERPATDADLAAARRQVHSWKPDGSSGSVSRSLILRDARRSYPAYFLADREAWRRIEEQVEGNLALSPEEENLLDRILNATEGRGLPCFINGRAGSGKSTMLILAFASLCHKKYGAANELPGELLYLTWSERLLERARASLDAVLSTHHRFHETRGLDAGTTEKILNECLHPFRCFLLSLLPPEKRERFAREKYVDFARFKELLGSFRLNLGNLAPSLCWHVIRVYLKGYFVEITGDAGDPEESLFNTDDYEEIPRKERTVSTEAFKAVHRTVWPCYKRACSEQGLWDDQDLVRTVLLENHCLPKYAAIFCDEAQDLTRLEMQFVMRLSLFRQYDLSNIAHVASLPFAFAGDPFQTLNPTGFRWAALHSAFHAEVASALDAASRWNLRLDPYELKENYRSSEPIVRLCNLVQLYRSVLFDLEGLRPQSSWFRTETAQPVKFIVGRNLDPQEMAKHLGDTILLVPCEEGEERQFIEGDPLLRQMVGDLRPGATAANVLSAAAAKGLEFDKVVLWKFGDRMPLPIPRLAELGVDPEEHENPLTEHEYHFNKLYVAASRPMAGVFIIDTEDGDTKLWDAMTRFRAEYVRQSKSPAAWEPATIESIALGTPANLIAMREENPESVAREFEQAGLGGRNADLLRRASEYWQRSGKQNDAERCLAHALWYEGKHREAGRKLEDLGQLSAASDVYWDKPCWAEVLAVETRLGRVEGERAKISTFMRDPSPQQFEVFYRFVADKPENANPLSKQWREAVSSFSNRAMGRTPSDWSSLEWAKIAKLLEELRNRGFSEISNSGLGQCYYLGLNYPKAVTLWEGDPREETRRTDSYYIAKAYTLGFPQGLQWLAKMTNKTDADERILAAWSQRNPDESVAPWVPQVAPVLERRGRHREAFGLYLATPGTGPDKALDVLLAFPQLTEEETREGIAQLVDYLCSEERYGEAIDVGRAARSKGIRIVSGVGGLDIAVRVLQHFARSKQDYSSSRAAREPLQTAAKGLLASGDWSKRLSLAEMGAALERIGHHVDALEFYERYLNAGDSRVRQYARERWVVTKRRHIETARQESGLSSEAVAKVRAYEEELKDRCNEWGLSVELAEPEFPELEAIGSSVPAQGGDLEAAIEGKIEEVLSNAPPQRKRAILERMLKRVAHDGRSEQPR